MQLYPDQWQSTGGLNLLWVRFPAIYCSSVFSFFIMLEIDYLWFDYHFVVVDRDVAFSCIR